MKIDERLNFVIPIVDDQDRPVAYVHSTPISREVFESYFFIIAKTFSAIYGEGLGVISGPRVAALIMRKVSEEADMWEGDGGVKQGLIAEVHRLTNVAVPGDSGWQVLPYEDAVKAGKISQEDAAEVENAITFFIVSSAMQRRSALRVILDGAASLWGALTSSLNSTEFAASLQTSKGAGSSGETAPASQLPY